MLKGSEFIFGFAILFASVVVHGEQDDLAINVGSTTYDSHASMALADDAATWTAWHSYEDSRDQIKVRRIAADGALSEIQVVNDEGSVHGPPMVVTDVGNSVWVVWPTQRDKHWQVVARELRGELWQPLLTVSDPANDAIFPTAAHSANGHLVVVWSGTRDQRLTIESRVFDGKQWGSIRAISSGENDAYRPTLAAEKDGNVWAFWDQYEDLSYTVKGRRVLPTLSEIEQISPTGQFCMKPTALATRHGLYVAWLRKQDVIGRPGVISQWHTLHVAVRQSGSWSPIAEDAPGAELTQGLMAKIDPKPVATGGYLGRRTAPMLLDDGQKAWLLWERKADHRGSTVSVTGDLVGRAIHNMNWQTPVVLYQGLVDYHLAHPPRIRNGRFILTASNVPRLHRRTYCRLQGNLSVTKDFQQDQWTGWQPVELPVASELTEHREIRVGEKTYKLFWADLHCHSRLSADAEGEPDELTHYARDRARLDAILISDNDFYVVPMTQYEYELGNFFARFHTQPQRFLSLQGYEWTSRIPRVPSAQLSDPGNWTHPYRNRSQSNHRTVIYPDAGGPILRFPEYGNDISRLHAAVQRAGGLTLTQHQAFQPTGHAVEVAMEVTAGWKRYIEDFPQAFHEPLSQGARLGFVANGDSHRRTPGLNGALTGFYAEHLTTAELLDALRQRRCFATNGSRIFVDARANGAIMGQEVTAKDRRVSLTLHAIGTRQIVSATLIRDGDEIKTFDGDGKHEFHASLNDQDVSPGTHWYYWRIAQRRSAPPLPGNLMTAHGHLAWSTPHYVSVTNETGVQNE